MNEKNTISISKVELQSPRFKILYSEYDKLIKAKNLSTVGTGMYQLCVKEFLYWLELQGISRIKKIEASEMLDYYEYITTRPNKRKEGTLSESMISHHLLSLSMLFDYLLATNQITSAVLLPKKNTGTYNEREVISLEELKLLYDNCQTKRERAILSVAYGCGLRRTEIHLLNTNDINFGNGMLVVRKGKLYKRREIPMSNNIIKDLKDYLVNERPNYLKENNRLEISFFINYRGKRMRGEHFNDVLKEIISRTKNQELIQKEISLHNLRHSISAHLIDNGADIEFVQTFLGHAQIDTAHIYARRRKIKMGLMNHQ